MIKKLFLQISLVALTFVLATAALAQCHTVTYDPPTLSTCTGQSNGAIDITVSGGFPPYQYTWSGPNGFSSNADDISNLADGSYTCIVYGSNNCFEQITVVLQ